MFCLWMKESFVEFTVGLSPVEQWVIFEKKWSFFQSFRFSESSIWSIISTFLDILLFVKYVDHIYGLFRCNSFCSYVITIELHPVYEMNNKISKDVKHLHVIIVTVIKIVILLDITNIIHFNLNAYQIMIYWEIGIHTVQRWHVWVMKWCKLSCILLFYTLQQLNIVHYAYVIIKREVLRSI